MLIIADKNIAGRDEGMAEVLMRLNAMSDQMSAMTGVIRGLSTTVENNTAATAANTTAIAANTTAIAAHTTAIEGIQAKMRQVEARVSRFLQITNSADQSPGSEPAAVHVAQSSDTCAHTKRNAIAGTCQ